MKKRETNVKVDILLVSLVVLLLKQQINKGDKMEDELKAEIATLKKKITQLEKIITNFKKYFDCWPRFATQLGLKDEQK